MRANEDPKVVEFQHFWYLEVFGWRGNDGQIMIDFSTSLAVRPACIPQTLVLDTDYLPHRRIINEWFEHKFPAIVEKQPLRYQLNALVGEHIKITLDQLRTIQQWQSSNG
jgi:hypothetical protein